METRSRTLIRCDIGGRSCRSRSIAAHAAEQQATIAKVLAGSEDSSRLGTRRGNRFRRAEKRQRFSTSMTPAIICRSVARDGKVYRDGVDRPDG